VTYSSCEGHWYGTRSLPPIARHVGIVPRTPEERQQIEGTLRSVARSLNLRHAFASVRVEVRRELLRDGDLRIDVIDLFLRPRAFCPWHTYFRALNRTYKELLIQLRRRLMEASCGE